MSIDIDIVIVNWNSGDQLVNCLKSIQTADSEEITVNQIIVDNDSEDDSLQKIYNIDFNGSVITNELNYGFAAACNQGARRGSSEYILFLNPDTILFESSLVVPLKFLECDEHESIGIVSIQLVDEYNSVNTSCRRLPTPHRLVSESIGLNKFNPSLGCLMKEWDHHNSKYVEQVMGAFFLTRRRVYESLDGFDERFFMYYEEVDFTCRAKQNGWDSYYLASAQAFHEGGGTSSQVKGKRLFYSLQSRILYSHKHFNRSSAILVTIMTLTIEFLTRMTWSALRGSKSDAKNTLKGYYMLWTDLPKLLKQITQSENK